MELKKHNRYEYSPISERPDYNWPEGKRIAVYFALNIEHFSFGEGLGHTPTNPGTQPDVRNFAWRDYGLRVGIWRVFDLFDDLSLPMCHLMNTSVYDYAPQIPHKIRERGDEFVGHGITNSEEQGAYPRDEEAKLISHATAAFRKHEGEGPADGWAPGSQKAHTRLIFCTLMVTVTSWIGLPMTSRSGCRRKPDLFCLSHITLKSMILRRNLADAIHLMNLPEWLQRILTSRCDSVKNNP